MWLSGRVWCGNPHHSRATVARPKASQSLAPRERAQGSRRGRVPTGPDRSRPSEGDLERGSHEANLLVGCGAAPSGICRGSGIRSRGFLNLADKLRPQEGEHREHAAVVVGAGRAGPSFVKMLVTCFSTARSVTNRRSAIAWFERPSAISSSTSRSRGVSSSSGSSARRRPTSWLTTAGSSAEPPSPTRRTALANCSRSAIAVLEQVADALGALGRAAPSRSRARRTARGRARPCRETAPGSPSRPAAPRPCGSAACGCRRRRPAACAGDVAEQVLGVAGLARDLEARLLEQPGDALAQQHRVVGDDDAHRVAERRDGVAQRGEVAWQVVREQLVDPLGIGQPGRRWVPRSRVATAGAACPGRLVTQDLAAVPGGGDRARRGARRLRCSPRP